MAEHQAAAAAFAALPGATVVLVPYTRLHPAAARLLNRHAPGHRREKIDPADYEAYWRLLAHWWREPGDLVVVEHDIGLHAGVLPGFETCVRSWCAHPYRLHRETRACLGATRFTAALKYVQPDLLDAVGADTCGEAPAKVWWRLDVRIEAELQRRGYRVHEHQPPVAHYHRYPAAGARPP